MEADVAAAAVALTAALAVLLRHLHLCADEHELERA